MDPLDPDTQLDSDSLQRALSLLGETLSHRGQSAELVVLGGSGLLRLGVIQRATHDVDVVGLLEDGSLATAEPLPPQLTQAAADVASVLGLAPDWLNGAPTSLLDFGLPEGFLERCVIRRFSTLAVYAASRLDQIHFKLYATADHGPRSKHVSDLRALAPSRAELLAAARWCRTHDPSEGFRESLRHALDFFGVEVHVGDL